MMRPFCGQHPGSNPAFSRVPPLLEKNRKSLDKNWFTLTETAALRK
jgi:hypothetical protein